MFRTAILSLILATVLLAQNYKWPIRASQSLSATFCEYRSGHLHAGIDIKTWGEMEVPCLAIADGYIERILIGYKGYGRGLFLRLNDGNVAVYGHLEIFTPILERSILAEQLEQDRYSVRLKFAPDQYPVKAGQVIGYSGTSGTEHPHLHFEIRDTLNQAVNPQLLYPGIKDTQPPILDEILLLPATPESRVNGSHFPVIIDLQHPDEKVHITGPFQTAVNAHDRANGTYNKYNIYQAEILVNDSLIYKRLFDQVPMRHSGLVDQVYPGIRGKRGWRFMSMFASDSLSLFAPEHLDGRIIPRGISSLEIRVKDIKGNQATKALLYGYQSPASWSVKQVDGATIITRDYPENNYERYQFYTGSDTFLPVAQTLYKFNSTTWIINTDPGDTGIRALGSLGGTIKWIIPPATRSTPELDCQWLPNGTGFILKLSSSEPTIFPLAYRLIGPHINFAGELNQTGKQQAETGLIPLNVRSGSDRLEVLQDTLIIATVDLQSLITLDPHNSSEFSLNSLGFTLQAVNNGSTPLYLHIDTTAAPYDDHPVIGASINIVGNYEDQFAGHITFQHPVIDSTYSIFKPGKKGSWKRLIHPDSSRQATLQIRSGGSFFLLQDNSAPRVKPLKRRKRYKTGNRLVFKISDNSRIIPHPRHSMIASIDGQKFFPDYNPLRKELSFHVPRGIHRGDHVFELTIQDESGNSTDFNYSFTVR
ncbi:MAG: M23 family metallopeptidase [Candidatus Marinimicrobia bacterium]|nr:M23 family metallopeptidase [Candidatus Neomarinimicrobiota bacterium]